MSLNFCVCYCCCCCCFRFRFRFSHFACPFGLVSFLRLRRQQWLAYVFCCSMDLLSRFHCHPRVVFNIICLSTCCGICSRQHSATAGHEGDVGEGVWGGRKDNKDTQTDAGTCTSVLAACFLSLFLSLVRSFELPFFSCLRFRLQRFPFFLLLLSPSFLLERSKPLIFGYVFLHFCSLFAFDLIVGSGCPPLPPFSLSSSLSVPAMCCLLTFNEMSTKDQALCDFSPTLFLIVCLVSSPIGRSIVCPCQRQNLSSLLAFALAFLQHHFPFD